MTKELERELDSLVYPENPRIVGSLGLSKSRVSVPGRPGYVYVRVLDNLNETIRAHNDKVAPTYGMPVEVEYSNGRWEIVGRDDTRYSDWKTSSAFLPLHGGAHSALKGAGGGADVVWVDTQQFMPLLVLPKGANGSQQVNVAESIFRNLSNEFIYAGNTGTPSYPYSSPDRFYLLMMRDSDGYLYSLTGTTLSSTLTGTAQVLSYIPVPPIGNVDHPLAAIRVRNTGTSIGWDQIIDMREIISRSQASAYTPTAHAASHAIGGSDILRSSDILFSNTGTALISTNVNSAIDEVSYLLHSITGSSLTVKEIDGVPTVSGVKIIRFSNGVVVDDGGGQVTVSITGSSGGGSASYPKTAVMWHDQSLVITGSALTRTNDYQQNYAHYVYQNPSADGDITENGFLIAAGTYTFSVLCITHIYRPFVDFYIDGSFIGTIDFYNGGLQYNIIRTITGISISDGYHTLRMVVNGRNVSASDWQVMITKMWFTPSAY